MKSILQSSLKTGFGIKIETKTTTHPTFEEGHCATVILNGIPIGVIGKINSKIIENYKIRVPVVGFEISLSESIFNFKN
jgi:phenylalanyl-tRNA synthetase beta chain